MYSNCTRHPTEVREFFRTLASNAVTPWLAVGALQARLYSVCSGEGEMPGTLLQFCIAQWFCVTAEITKTSERKQADLNQKKIQPQIPLCLASESAVTRMLNNMGKLAFYTIKKKKHD